MSERRRLGALAVLGSLLLSVVACDPNLFGPPRVDAGSNIDAGVAVRPLVTAVAAVPVEGSDAGAGRVLDGGIADAGAMPPPTPFLATDVVRSERLRSNQREPQGVSLAAHWRLSALPGRAEVAAANKLAIERLHGEMARTWAIELWARGRMRIDFVSRGLPLSPGSALLARYARYGHLLLWPQARAYRVMAAGTLRTAFNELRADRTPLESPSAAALEPGERLGMKTQRFRLRSAYGEMNIELARVAEAGIAAPLLCRTLLEIGGVDPSNEVCTPNQLPLAASYRWGEDDKQPSTIHFEVNEIRKQLAGEVSRFAMIPRGPRRLMSGLPHGSSLLTADELYELRSEAAAAPEPPQRHAPAAGLSAYNGSDALMWLFIDGLPAATVKPWQTLELPQLRNGRYNLHWRSYLGETIGEAAERDLPARTLFGKPPEDEQPPADAVPDAGPTPQ